MLELVAMLARIMLIANMKALQIKAVFTQAKKALRLMYVKTLTLKAVLFQVLLMLTRISFRQVR